MPKGIGYKPKKRKIKRVRMGRGNLRPVKKTGRKIKTIGSSLNFFS